MKKVNENILSQIMGLIYEFKRDKGQSVNDIIYYGLKRPYLISNIYWIINN